MITFRQKGDFRKLETYLKKREHFGNMVRLETFGEQGVTALRNATPENTGTTADSWGYRILQGDGTISIIFTNSNIQNGVPIAIILQYGHGTGTGGYVQGIDYINPAIRPVFEAIAKKAWEEVKNA